MEAADIKETTIIVNVSKGSFILQIEDFEIYTFELFMVVSYHSKM